MFTTWPTWSTTKATWQEVGKCSALVMTTRSRGPSSSRSSTRAWYSKKTSASLTMNQAIYASGTSNRLIRPASGWFLRTPRVQCSDCSTWAPRSSWAAILIKQLARRYWHWRPKASIFMKWRTQCGWPPRQPIFRAAAAPQRFCQGQLNSPC